MKAQCPNCTQHVEADDQMAGQVVSCPTCSHEFVLPKLATHWHSLRTIFVASLVLQLALKFLPAYRRDSQTYSSFEAMQYALASDPIGGMIVVGFWILDVLLIYWALKKPQRWVFVLGAVCSLLSAFMFVGGPERLVATMILTYIVCAAALVGFFIKPPMNQPSALPKVPVGS